MEPRLSRSYAIRPPKVDDRVPSSMTDCQSSTFRSPNSLCKSRRYASIVWIIRRVAGLRAAAVGDAGRCTAGLICGDFCA